MSHDQLNFSLSNKQDDLLLAIFGFLLLKLTQQNINF